jgi:drug/metabolite transporter (DMT)-like permease
MVRSVDHRLHRLIAALGIGSLTHAYHIAAVNTVAPFQYSAILWALQLDLAIWQAVPPVSTPAGVAMIIGAGIYVLRASRSAGG